jgi:hypothetical protein
MAFEFTGKIDSATFVDRQNTVIEILFKRDDELHVYNLPVDYGAADFKEFLSEWSLEQVEQETRNTRRAADEAFDKMIQGRIADAMAKGQADLDEQDKRRYIIAQKTLDEQDKKRWMLAQKALDEQDKERYAIAQAALDEQDKERWMLAQKTLDKQDKERYAIAQKALDEQDKERYEKAQKVLEKQDKDRYDHFQKEMEIYKLKLEADIDKTDRERYELAEAYKKELEHHADLIDKKRYDLADEYKKALEAKVDKNEQERIELWRLNNPTSAKALAPSDLLMFADQFNENKNFLFDLKLSIFEDPIVASNKDKQTKLAIRKSKNIYEVLELYCKIKRLQAYKNVL